MKFNTLIYSLLFALITFLVLVSGDAFADINPTINCHVMMLITGQPALDKDIVAPFASGQSHGGKDFEFVDGTDKLTISVDAKWLNLAWTRGSDMIAAATIVSEKAATSNHVAILYNPKNPEERVGITCSAPQI